MNKPFNELSTLTVGQRAKGKWCEDHNTIDVVCEIVKINLKKQTLTLKVIASLDENGDTVEISNADENGFLVYNYFEEKDDDSYYGRALAFA